MKRTFVVPDEKEGVYDKFKKMVPEVSGQLMAFIEDYVNKHEALQAGMTEHPVYKGTENRDMNIFEGKTFKFNGVLLSEGPHEGFPDDYIKVYLTLKKKFLVSSVLTLKNRSEAEYSYSIYENYADLSKNAKLSVGFIKDCEAYLSKNSTIRTYEVLDV